MNKLIPVLFALVLFSSAPAFAHKLLAVHDDNTMYISATHIPNPFENSYFTLEKFETQGQSHWYSFYGIKGHEILIQTLVPDIEHSKNFTPCFDLLIGQEKVIPTPMKVPYIDHLSKTKWNITCELKITLPDNGLYYIRAHDELYHYHIGDVGKFSLNVGTVDNFSIFDWMQVPFWLLHVNLFFENINFVWIVLTLLVVMTVIILFATMRRNE